MSMELLNHIQGTIIENLARYGFLAVSQFHILTNKSVGYLREMLGSLSRRGYIKSYRVEVSYKVRAENMYFLTPLGKEFLLSHKNVFAEDIKLPVSANPVVVRDYFHRYNFISVHIAVYQFCIRHEMPLEFFLTYFDKIGSVKGRNLTAKTALVVDGQTFIPDGILKISNSLYLLEMYCDKDTKRILKQLGTHGRVIALGVASKTYNTASNANVLSVYQHKGIMEAVIKRLADNPAFAPMSKLFFFATLADIISYGNAWKDINGNPLVIIK